jgi:methyltransferase (TIGR00027 family)
VAVARAIGAREPDSRIRNPDWLAEKLLGEEELSLLGDGLIAKALSQPYEEAVKELEVVGWVRMLLPRTHFIDERLQAAVLDGATQVVIMGAGFDSRAYRFADLLKDAKVFEVDQPATQGLKIARIREAIGEAPPNLTYVPLDFRHEKLGDALLSRGYERGRRTFFVWEGVTMYLPEEAVVETLRWIATNSAPGSAIVFDYTYQSVIRMLGSIDLEKLPEMAKQAVMRFRRLTAGEPWLFGVPDKGEEAFLGGVGLKLRKVLGMNSAEAVEKYLTRQDGTIFGSFPATEQQGYFILEAEVV